MSLPNVERFVALIRERTGNVVPLARRGFLGEVLSRRARAAGLEVPEYVDRLADAALSGEAAEEWDALIPMVTIKESYFFRAPQQFAALERQILPRLVKARSEERRIRAWSAACARGEEPGTLAILLAESNLLRGWEWEIVATDVDQEALETARRGLYGDRAVARVPPAQQERWFEARGKLYELSPVLRRRIRYRFLNLARPPYRGLHGSGGRGGGKVAAKGDFDLIFLRNVLIYFPRPLQRRVVATVADSLAEDGALFLGASETLWQIQRQLAAYDLGNCFCYGHRQEGEEEGTLSSFAPVEVEVGTPVVSPPPDGDVVRREGAGISDVPWLDFRGPEKASVQEEPTRADPVDVSGEPSPAPGPDPTEAEAGPVPPTSEAALVEALEAQEDDDASHILAEPCGIQERLLEVAGRLEAGELESAARELEQVLQADPSEPAAHALDGFLHDLREEPEEAIQSYRAALYLDPALYQVRLLLADCMKRHGWDRRAAHEYREVLAALAAGRDRLLVPFDPLPVPDREGAERRCRRALGGG